MYLKSENEVGGNFTLKKNYRKLRNLPTLILLDSVCICHQYVQFYHFKVSLWIFTASLRVGNSPVSLPKTKDFWNVSHAISLMVFWFLWAIYLGLSQCLLWFVLVFLSPISIYILCLLGMAQLCFSKNLISIFTVFM